MTSKRTRMRLVERLKGKGICHPDVLKAILSIPRHLFIDEALAHRAYEDTALPIGLGQTISQPYIVAKMTETILKDKKVPLRRVLEIGTGSGYQAAILSCVAKNVYSIERIAALFYKTKTLFRKLRLANIQAILGDGNKGWTNDLKFDAIIVTAAAQSLPVALLKQLDEGGILVIPEGEEGGAQVLNTYQKCGNEIIENTIEMVSFVPMLSGVVK